MSGLCGWANWSAGDASTDRLDLMAEGLPTAPFDRASECQVTKFGVALRHWSADRHLAQDGQLFVAISGYPSWRNESLAAQALANGPARTLLDLYRRRDVELFDELRGAFALAILDGARRRVLLAIDRLGIEPLCYGIGRDGTLVFGSTTDSVKTHGALGSDLRLQSIYDYFHFIDRIPAPHSIYREQRKLIPAHYLLFEDGKIEERAYWSMPYRDQSPETFESLAETLRESLQNAVARSLTHEDAGRVGAYLSGGLDSSSMLGMLAKVSPVPPRTFTVGFNEEAYDESRYAQIAATRFEADHTLFTMEPQHTFEAAEKILRAYDEPFANSSALPAYYCALKARETGIETMLAGDGGDEIFAGNTRYVKDAVFDHYRRVPTFLRRGLLEPVLNGLPRASERIGLLRRARNYAKLGSMSVGARMTSDNIFRAQDPATIFAPDFLAEIDPTAPIRLAEEIYQSAPGDSKVQKMMYLDLRITIADSDIRKVSRMCELAGVRVRYPFLDDELVAFSAKVPPGLLLEGGRIRDFYKRAMVGFLPQEILDKPKHGFGLPYLEHVAGYPPLRDYCADSLRSLTGRGIFRKDFLEQMVSSLQDRDARWYHGVTWDFVALEQWFQSRSDRQGSHHRQRIRDA